MKDQARAAASPAPSSSARRRPLKAEPWKPPTISQAQEALVHLYLRLNGYLTTGFIVHSRQGIKTQVDAVAVRHPHNAEPERVIEPSPFLRPSNELIDVLICEVKTGEEDLAFNPALSGDRDALATVIRWVGLFPEEPLAKVVDGVMPLLAAGCPKDRAKTGFTKDGVRVRGLLCAPELEPHAVADTWFLPRPEILTFVHECLTHRRERSGTRYSFDGWGPWLEPLVRYFKELKAHREADLQELYAFAGAIRQRE